MMAKRILVPVPFMTVCSAPTLEQTVNDLQTELRRTQVKLSEESIKRAKAEAQVAILKRQRVKQPVTPEGDEDEGYWCPNCQREITDEFSFCPDCGHEIDWTGWSVPEPTEDDYQPRKKPKLDACDLKALKTLMVRRGAV